MMSTNLISFTFFMKTPQHLKMCWDLGAVSIRFASGKAKAKIQDNSIQKAKSLAYRSRSAYKLIELDQKFNLLKPGDKTLDIGAAPGSWSEFLAYRTNANKSESNSPVGMVVAVDLANLDDIEGVITLPSTDFLKQSSQEKIMKCLPKGEKFDFIFSDVIMQTGVESIDKERLMKFLYCVILFSIKSLKQDGGVLLKVLQNRENTTLKKEMKRFFKTVKFAALKGRKVFGSDIFVIGTGFKGVK